MTEYKIIAHSLTSKERTKDVTLTENISFSSMILPPTILKGLSDAGFERPSPIQVKALPVGRCGFDIIVKSKSGTGKTLVFGIVSLESVKLKKCQPQVLILAPTREIAVQIQEVLRNIGKHFEGLSVECFIGGLPIQSDKTKCKSCHIAVGTPGRVKQLIQEGSLSVNSVKIFVLDEADKLTEDSFQNDINDIYNRLPDYKQIIMCSATYPDQMQEFLSRYMRSPVVISVELDTPLLLGLRQYVRMLKSMPNIVQQIKVKNNELLKILSTIPFVQCLIFSNYQNRAESISSFLNRNDWNSIFMSAAQNQSERLSSLSNLKDFKTKILVTTDLTARGIDAPNVDLVINYDVPVDTTTYLHRMGRAGRYGSIGKCITLIINEQETKSFQNILGTIGGQNMSIPILDDTLNLDVNFIPKDKYLFGEIADLVSDFNTYRNMINQIRSSVAKSYTKQSDRVSKIEETKLKDAKEQDNVSSVLDQLASGSFDLSKTSNASEPISEKLVKDKDEKNCFEPSLFLHMLANDGEIIDNAAGDLEIITNSQETVSNENVSKNKALLSVSKLLCNMETTSDDCSGLSTYFSKLKSQECLALDDDKNKCNVRRDSDILENIFSLAYKSQVKKDFKKWQEFLSDSDKRKLSDNFDEKNVEEINQNENGSDEEQYDEDYDFEIENEIEVNYANNGNEYKFMEWIPVEPQNSKKNSLKVDNSQGVALTRKMKKSDNVVYYSQYTKPEEAEKYYEQYSRYFHHSSSSLWQNGLKFDSVNSFDHWFLNNWEKQLSAVRDFVQNKVYLEEMANYY